MTTHSQAAGFRRENDGDAAVGRTKRIRLSAQVRSQQLLDAALAEFSARGYAEARIQDIARRAGLSKSGVYAHYRSKAEIFTALLDRALLPVEADLLVIPEDGSLDAVVDQFIDRVHQRVSDPVIAATFRLLIAESFRVPELIRRWYHDVVLPHHRMQERILQQAVAQGRIQRSPLTENFAVAYAPAMYRLMTEMVHVGYPVPGGNESLREAHRQMMRALLRAP